jgi:ribonuclease HI
MSDELKQVIIYTDGAAVPNPGAGGYGTRTVRRSRLRAAGGESFAAAVFDALTSGSHVPRN